MLQLSLLLKYLPFSVRLRLEQHFNSTLATSKPATPAPLVSTQNAGRAKASNYANLFLSFSSSFSTPVTYLISILQEIRITLLNTWKCLAGEGFIQLKVATVVFIADALISDDEPL
jgi:hypothetical protein